MTSDPQRDTAAPIGHGDRVAAARDIETTQGLYIPKGCEGTVAEDRDPPWWSTSTTKHRPATSSTSTLRGLAE